MLKIDRLQAQCRAGGAPTAQDGLWLVEKVNQLRHALAMQSTQVAIPHPLVMQMASKDAERALLDACLEDGAEEPPRGNESWAEWGLDKPAKQ
jgi:hypothetical protein